MSVVTAVATPEIVDLTQIHNIAEMWSSGAMPDGTYVAATITIDYTDAVICGHGEWRAGDRHAVLDYTAKTTPTTYAVTVQFDPLTPPTHHARPMPRRAPP